ncbi:MAG: class I SAM-dependent methyltransferase [Nitrososphaerales archaeon]
MTGFLRLSISEKFRARRYRIDIRIFLELLSPAKNDVILDVGAGTGWIADRVASICDETYALEPNESRLAFITAKHPQVKAFSATSQTVPFSEGYFDKLYIIFAFHHFPDQEDSLEEFRRILKPGGLLLIQEYFNTRTGLGSSIERKIMKSKVRFLDPPELKNILALHGFKSEVVRNGSAGYFLLSRRDLQ